MLSATEVTVAATGVACRAVVGVVDRKTRSLAIASKVTLYMAVVAGGRRTLGGLHFNLCGAVSCDMANLAALVADDRLGLAAALLCLYLTIDSSILHSGHIFSYMSPFFNFPPRRFLFFAAAAGGLLSAVVDEFTVDFCKSCILRPTPNFLEWGSRLS
jgi:hypothetical protein